ncbi:MAG: glutamate--tRNA ligase [Halobellus sp.]|uniref:glutamate--tRNA ligase n=1 Tax=Halobellus sp. TaxID=1979212 RepID=UPI0035D43049
MDEDLRERVEREAEKHALLNAVKYESDADVGAVMGPLMGENPDFRPHGDEIPGIIGSVVAQVNDLSTEEKRDRLETLAPEELAAIEAEDEGDEHDLPDLPNVDDDEVRMRAAPNPNGPWHIGHARMPAVIGRYKKRYDGSFVVRFDDTDPETKRPDLDAYDAILEDIDYLGFEPDDVILASDRLETYYEHARNLIDAGGAYTCSCSGETFSKLKNDGEACPHRKKDRETTRDEFASMVEGEYDAGEMVLRVRTDIEHKNPALRDWVAFRMIDTPHPRNAAAEYRCWPMLDFQSGVDDHLTGVTHIIRGIDLQDSAKRQRFVYDYFDWAYPEVIHWGHVQVDAYDVQLSTSTLKERIDAGELDGWDDPRAPTLKSLRRRGIRGEAVVEALAALGTSTSNVDLSMSAVYAENRDLVDDEAERYFLVRDGQSFAVEGGPDAGQPPLHPDHESRGERTIPAADGVVIEPADVPAEGDPVWLKGYACVRRESDSLVATGDDIDVVREGSVDVIHWAPATDNVAVRLRTPDGDVSGVAEPDFRSTEEGNVVQFERIGFARVDDHGDEESVAYWSHP